MSDETTQDDQHVESETHRTPGGSNGELIQPAGEVFSGEVKWFNDAKGFDFIEHPSGKDVFVHYSVIETEGFKTLKDGEKVSYQISEGEKGLHASRVVRTSAEKRSSGMPPMEISRVEGGGDQAEVGSATVGESLNVESEHSHDRRVENS